MPLMKRGFVQYADFLLDFTGQYLIGHRCTLDLGGCVFNSCSIMLCVYRDAPGFFAKTKFFGLRHAIPGFVSAWIVIKLCFLLFMWWFLCVFCDLSCPYDVSLVWTIRPDFKWLGWILGWWMWTVLGQWQILEVFWKYCDDLTGISYVAWFWDQNLLFFKFSILVMFLCFLT